MFFLRRFRFPCFASTVYTIFSSKEIFHVKRCSLHSSVLSRNISPLARDEETDVYLSESLDLAVNDWRIEKSKHSRIRVTNLAKLQGKLSNKRTSRSLAVGQDLSSGHCPSCGSTVERDTVVINFRLPSVSSRGEIDLANGTKTRVSLPMHHWLSTNFDRE